MDRVNDKPNGKQAVELLEQILAVLERIEDGNDDFRKTYLDSRFPFGKPVDRWRRRA